MPQQNHQSTVFDHNAYARTKDSTDFWGQIRRTVNGKPVSEEQIMMIVTAIRESLQLRPVDVVLDLACGNGALSNFLFEYCSSLHGVDFSEFLISVAKDHFEREPNLTFKLNDITTYLQTENTPERFTKALCYGSFSYLTEDDAIKTLTSLCSKFYNVEHLFIGNLPDFDRKHIFYTKNTPPSEEYKLNTTSIGIWRTKNEMASLAESAGWNVMFSEMPEKFYSSGYRYDVLLTR